MTQRRSLLRLARCATRCLQPASGSHHAASDAAAAVTPPWRRSTLQAGATDAASSSTPRFLFHAAVYLILERDGQLLLSKRRGTGFADGSYSLVCGHVDGGETVPQAAQREALEEAGLRIPLDALTVRCVQHRPSGDREYFDFYVAAARWRGTPVNLEPHKCAQLAWFPANALPPETLDYVRAALRVAREGGTPYTSWGWRNDAP